MPYHSLMAVLHPSLAIVATTKGIVEQTVYNGERNTMHFIHSCHRVCAISTSIRGGHIHVPFKKNHFPLFWAPIVHTPFTGVACWKLKGLLGSCGNLTAIWFKIRTERACRADSGRSEPETQRNILTSFSSLFLGIRPEFLENHPLR
jgi:hypothetical protein